MDEKKESLINTSSKSLKQIITDPREIYLQNHINSNTGENDIEINEINRYNFDDNFSSITPDSSNIAEDISNISHEILSTNLNSLSNLDNDDSSESFDDVFEYDIEDETILGLNLISSDVLNQNCLNSGLDKNFKENSNTNFEKKYCIEQNYNHDITPKTKIEINEYDQSDDSCNSDEEIIYHKDIPIETIDSEEDEQKNNYDELIEKYKLKETSRFKQSETDSNLNETTNDLNFNSHQNSRHNINNELEFNESIIEHKYFHYTQSVISFFNKSITKSQASIIVLGTNKRLVLNKHNDKKIHPGVILQQKYNVDIQHYLKEHYLEGCLKGHIKAVKMKNKSVLFYVKTKKRELKTVSFLKCLAFSHLTKDKHISFEILTEEDLVLLLIAIEYWEKKFSSFIFKIDIYYKFLGYSRSEIGFDAFKDSIINCLNIVVERDDEIYIELETIELIYCTIYNYILNTHHINTITRNENYPLISLNTFDKVIINRNSKQIVNYK